jgi:kynureninase
MFIIPQEILDLDASDELAPYRTDFYHNELEELIYLDGNSLGRLPLSTVNRLNDIISYQWGKRLIRSWNEHWLETPKRVAEKIATLVGAKPNEIFVGDSTSVNLYKLAFAALQYAQDKDTIVSDSLNFPSDYYIFEGLIKESFKSHKLAHIPAEGDHISTETAKVDEVLKSHKTALLSLSLVAYQSAFFYDMAEINRLAKKYDTLTLWDLSHATGAVPIELNKSGADLAVGCTYKYLNGGPGSPAFLYVREDLQEKLLSPIWGWFGHDKPFDFGNGYEPAKDIQRFGAGTPTILSIAGIEVGAEILNEAGMHKIREKSIQLSTLFLTEFKTKLAPLGFGLASPENAAQRGSHISLTHDEAYRVNRALIEPQQKHTPKIIPDFRPPNRIRFGFTPLYTSFEDVYSCVLRLEQIITTKEYEAFGNERLTVT